MSLSFYNLAIFNSAENLFNFIPHLTQEGPEQHVSCLARHYFTTARKMLWSCED